MDTKKDFDYKSFEQEAIARLRSGDSLSGKNGILSPLLKRFLEAGLSTCLKIKAITVTTA
jgi:hypothetical protein